MSVCIVCVVFIYVSACVCEVCVLYVLVYEGIHVLYTVGPYVSAHLPVRIEGETLCFAELDQKARVLVVLAHSLSLVVQST